jgi:hypothetical protein
VPGLYQAHEPELTELGERAERALRFSFLAEVWVEAERHNPRKCVCYLLPVFFNHAACDWRTGSLCQCVGCVKVRKKWKRR